MDANVGMVYAHAGKFKDIGYYFIAMYDTCCIYTYIYIARRSLIVVIFLFLSNWNHNWHSIKLADKYGFNIIWGLSQYDVKL